MAPMDSRKPRARIETAPSLAHPYAGLTVGFATKHDKARLVAPHFASMLSVSIETIDFDTDSLGTFSGEVQRRGSALDVAFEKARVGAGSCTHGLGLGSEGTIGPSYELPMLTSDVEVLAFVDIHRNTSVSEFVTSHSIKTIAMTVQPHTEFHSRLVGGGFPEHGVIVMPADGSMSPVYKGLHSFGEVDSAVRICAVASSNGRARIETDFRADHCPSRRPAIAEAASRLVARLRELCPECNAPGWGVVSHERGVPCSLCGGIVDVAAREVHGCTACGTRRVSTDAIRTSVSPARCPRCNP